MELSFAFFFNSILLGIGLAMDAFSVSLANGLHEPHMSRRKLCGVAGVFAFFQALMPMAGWICVHPVDRPDPAGRDRRQDDLRESWGL